MGTDREGMGPGRGVVTARADADVTLVDLGCAEAQGSALLFFFLLLLLLPLQTGQHPQLLLLLQLKAGPGPYRLPSLVFIFLF